MSRLETFRSRLKHGKVYRRAELSDWSTAVDRHLKALLEDGTLKKLSPGVYHRPKRTAFGELPADDAELVRKFLKDDRFLITSYNLYNTLGVGTSQLYNAKIVYNHKRHGEFKLGGRLFSFRVKPGFPMKSSREFLLVDLLNNLELLEEDREAVLPRALDVAVTMDRVGLMRNVELYGSVRTRKVLRKVLGDSVR